MQVASGMKSELNASSGAASKRLQTELMNLMVYFENG